MADLPPPARGFLQPILEPYIGSWLYTESWHWTIIGFVGAGLFSARFVIQWLSTEKNKRLTVPPAFWYCSFWGSVINCLYLFHVDKAPLIFANCFLPVLYLRNLIFLRKLEDKTLKGGSTETSRGRA